MGNKFKLDETDILYTNNINNEYCLRNYDNNSSQFYCDKSNVNSSLSISLTNNNEINLNMPLPLDSTVYLSSNPMGWYDTVSFNMTLLQLPAWSNSTENWYTEN